MRSLALLLAAGVVVVMGAALAPAASVSAHAELEEVTPADGQLVDEPPGEVTLRFSERVSLGGGSARVLDDAGSEVGGEPSIVDTSVVIPLAGDVADGTYVVAWRVVSADSHPISGTSVFHVGAPSADPEDVLAGVDSDGEAGPGVRLAANLATLALYASVLVAVGAWWLGQVLFRADDGDVPDVLRALVAGTAAAGIVAAWVWLPMRIMRLGGGATSLRDGDFVGQAVRGPLGVAFAVTAVGLGLMLSGLNRSRLVVAVGTAAALAGFVFEGHTRTKDPTWAVIALDATHLAGGAFWLGGLVGLVLVLRSEPAAARRAAAVSRFSAMALWTVAGLGAAGLGMSWLILRRLSSLVDTGYGLALITKVAVVTAVVAVAAYNRFRLVPAIAQHDESEQRASHRLSRTLRAEMALLLVVLATTAVLVSRSPDTTAAASNEAPPQPVSVEVTLGQGAGTASLGVTPASPGENEVALSLVAPDGVPIQPFEPPVVEFRERALELGPIRPLVHELVDGNYHIYVDLPFAGSWETTVRVRLDEFTSVSGSATVTVSD